MYPVRPVRLVIAGKTRWWGNIKQNKRFIRLQPALIRVLGALLNDDSIKVTKKVNFDFSNSDWQVMSYFVDLLDPFKRAIKELEGEKYPTLSLVLKHLYSLNDFINNRYQALQGNSQWHARARDMVTFLRGGLQEIIAELPEEAYIASLLDPRFLDAYIPENRREHWWNRLAELVAQEAVPLPHPPQLQAPPQEPVPAPAQARQGTRQNPSPAIPKKSYDEIMAAKLLQKAAKQADEKPYRDVHIINNKSNVGAWWKTHETIYPAEAALARRYLAIPATSAPSERLFSTGGRVIEKRRAALKPSTARAIILVHEHIALLEDVQFNEYLY